MVRRVAEIQKAVTGLVEDRQVEQNHQPTEVSECDMRPSSDKVDLPVLAASENHETSSEH